MKKLIEVTDEGYEAFLGKRITLYCGIYIYTGTLVGVNDDFLKLEDAAIVYETGAHNTNEWADAQRMPNDWYVRINAVESFGAFK